MKPFRYFNQSPLCVECSMLVSRLTSAARCSVRCPLLSLKASPRPLLELPIRWHKKRTKNTQKNQMMNCLRVMNRPQYNYTGHYCHHTSKPLTYSRAWYFIIIFNKRNITYLPTYYIHIPQMNLKDLYCISYI